MFKIRHGNSLYFLNTTPIYPRCETYCTDFTSIKLEALFLCATTIYNEAADAVAMKRRYHYNTPPTWCI